MGKGQAWDGKGASCEALPSALGFIYFRFINAKKITSRFYEEILGEIESKPRLGRRGESTPIG